MQTEESINQHNQPTESVATTIPTVIIYHISEPIMSENSPKILSFRLFGEVFHSPLREHCETVRHTARFFPLFIRFYFLSASKSNFRCLFPKTIIILGLESHSNKLHFPDKTTTKNCEMNFCHAPSSERRVWDPRIVID